MTVQPGAVLSRQTQADAELVRAILEACSIACAHCAEECETHAEHHEHCRACTEQCRQCEQACKDLLSSLSS